MKKFLISISLIIILISGLAMSVYADYVGSIYSNIYHYAGCYWANQINPNNRIWFKDVPQAKNCGYRACNVCKPPNASYTTVSYTQQSTPKYKPSITATDVRTFINGFEIPTFTYSGDDITGKNSCIVVLAEDLTCYGFNVEWDPKFKQILVTDNDYKKISPIPMDYYRTFKKGAKVFDITNGSIIIVKLKSNNRSHYVRTKYNLNGYVAINVDELANIADFNWNSSKRIINIVSR